MRVGNRELKIGDVIEYGRDNTNHYISAIDEERKILHLYNDIKDYVFSIPFYAINAVPSN